MKDEVDGLYLAFSFNRHERDGCGGRARDTELLRITNAGDFSVIIPAELLAQQETNRGTF